MRRKAPLPGHGPWPPRRDDSFKAQGQAEEGDFSEVRDDTGCGEPLSAACPRRPMTDVKMRAFALWESKANGARLRGKPRQLARSKKSTACLSSWKLWIT